MPFVLAGRGKFASPNTGGTPSAPMNVGSPSLIVAWVGFQDPNKPTLTDNKGNTYIRKDPLNFILGGSRYLAMYYAWGALNGGTDLRFTLSAAGATISASLCWTSWTGARTTSDPFVKFIDNKDESNAQVLSTGALTAAAWNLLVTGIWPFGDLASGASINAGFTFSNGMDYVGTPLSYASADAYKISSGAPESPTWTMVAPQSYSMAMLAEFAAATPGRAVLVGHEGTTFAGGVPWLGPFRRQAWRRTPAGVLVPA